MATSSGEMEEAVTAPAPARHHLIAPIHDAIQAIVRAVDGGPQDVQARIDEARQVIAACQEELARASYGTTSPPKQWIAETRQLIDRAAGGAK